MEDVPARCRQRRPAGRRASAPGRIAGPEARLATVDTTAGDAFELCELGHDRLGAASMAVTDVSLVGDDRRGTALWAAPGYRVGLLSLRVWLGASTVTAGSVVRELLADVAACETPMPPGPHVNSAMQEQPRVRRDKDLMTTSSQFPFQSQSTLPNYSQFTRVSRAPYTQDCRHDSFMPAKATSRARRHPTPACRSQASARDRHWPESSCARNAARRGSDGSWSCGPTWCCGSRALPTI